MVGRVWSSERAELLKRLVKDGLSATQIGVEMELTRNQVIGYCHRNKIELAKRTSTEPMKDVKKRPKISATQARSAKEGSNHFNFRRATELASVASTSSSWPKIENDNSVDIFEAQAHQCRMPLWGHFARSGKICGQPKLRPSVSYCASCYKLAYTPAKRQTEAPRY